MIEHAAEVGRHLRAGLETLAGGAESVAEVRGRGLLAGRGARPTRPGDPIPGSRPAVLDGARDRGVLVGSTGPHANVLKVRPPLVVRHEEVDLVLAALEACLG